MKKTYKKRRIKWLRLLTLIFLVVIVAASLRLVETNIIEIYGRQTAPAVVGFSTQDPGIIRLQWAGNEYQINFKYVVDLILKQR